MVLLTLSENIQIKFTLLPGAMILPPPEMYVWSMPKASGLLFLDDDEVFDDVQELINFFQSGEYLHYGSAYYYVRNYASDGTYNMGIVGRMVRRKSA